MQLGIDDDITPSDRLFADPLSREIERATFSREPALGRTVLRVNRTHASSQAFGADHNPVTDRNCA